MNEETTHDQTQTETSAESSEATQAEVHHDTGDTPADHEDSLDVGNIFTKMAEEELASDAEEDSPAEEMVAKGPEKSPPEDVIETPSAEKPKEEAATAEADKAIKEVEGEVTAKPAPEKTKEQLEAEQKAIDDVAAAAETVVPEKATQDQSAELMSLLNEKRGETIDVLAQSHYAFDDEQFRELDENPREAIPKIIAGVYLDAVQGSVAAILGQMPQIITALESRKTEDLAAENKFYEQFPLLAAKPEYKAHVTKVSIMHRKLNPKATLDEMIRDVGLQASVAFKLAVPESVRETGKTDTVMPHVPASAKSQAPAATPGAAKDVNPYTQMAEDMIEDDAS